MKKIILGLFLILGVVSFAAPNFVDMAKVKNAGYVIKNEREDILTMATSDDDSAIIISFSTINMSSKEISDLLKSNALRDSGNFIATLDNNRAYINEFEAQGFYSYVVVPKKQKLGKYKIYATYATVKKLPKDAINSTVKSVINEAEGLIK